MTKADYHSEQEEFWAGEFGDRYIERNQGDELLASNLNFFAKALGKCETIQSAVEFGANVGMNLKALKLLYPKIKLNAVEINSTAASALAAWLGQDSVFNGSILDYPIPSTAQLSLIKGVLIHINPELLPAVYDKLYAGTHQYLLVCEYYNPSPVSISYRGATDKLFKRDFAGEMLDRFSDLKLIDYGFAYRRDPAFPQDDISWFLMEKR